MSTDLDEYSASAVPLQMTVNGYNLGIGSGFFWESAEKLYLITNWHNVSGINPLTGENISKTGGRPDTLLVGINGANPPERGLMTLPLYDDDAPIWLVHPVHGKLVDVVAIPIRPGTGEQSKARFYPINTLSSRPLQITIGTEVYILGYPFSKTIADRGGWPIWKRASIASEPALMRNDELYVLVDTASRPGMSGSPVIARTVGDALLDDGSLATVIGSSTRFFGVYAGRITSSDALDAQLGRVYPAEFLEEIIHGQALDRLC